MSNRKLGKIGTAILAAMLSLSVLAGCSGQEAPTSDPVSNPDNVGNGTNAAGEVLPGVTGGAGDATGITMGTGQATNASGQVIDGSEPGDKNPGNNGSGGNATTNKQGNGNNGTTTTTKSGGSGGGAATLPGTVKPGQVIEASFTRNADGTCTDKETGVIFLDDDLNTNDWSKSYAHGTGLQFDSNEAALMEGDDSRLLRAGNDSWISYKLDAGITEIGIVTFYAGEKEDGTFTDSITVEVSKDNKTWTKVTMKTTDTSLGYGWTKRVYTATGLDKANKYMRLTILENKKIGYNPNVSRLRLNNIAKMDDADRYLEGRASATYYVDSKNGSDTNDGLSEDKAFKSLFKISGKFFQPGDKVLFKKGQTYNGSLNIKGYGTAENPVVFGTYGSGDKPKIAARGGTAVSIKATYITFDGFEVTNSNGLIGIYVMPAQSGANKNITISNCNIHDINFTNEQSYTYEGSGAIIVYADAVEPVWFENVKVTGNTITNTGRMGILYTSQWAYRPGRWGKNVEGTKYAYKDDNTNWFAFTGSSITNNTLTNIGGDAIMVCGTKNTVIEKNVVYNAFCTKKNKNIAAAAIWTTNTNDSVMQYNEVGYTNLPAGGTDGDGFDIDISEVRTTVQYNYSHNNQGGFLLMCNFGDGYKVSKDAVVRYNLSVDDGNGANTGGFIMTGWIPGSQIYNNTIFSSFTDKRHVSIIHIFGSKADVDKPKDVTFTNNIFAGVPGNNYDWSSALENSGGDFTKSCTNFKFVNNLFYNVSQPTSGGGVSLSGSVTSDPGFTVKAWSEADYKNKAAMIKNLTPTKSIGHPAFVSGDAKKDINGDTLSQGVYGAVKY